MEDGLIRTVEIKDGEKSIDGKRLELVESEDFGKKLMVKLDKDIRKVIDGRFSNESRKAFNVIKKITRYNSFDKRDGGFMERIRHEGRIVNGEEM